MAAWHSAQLQRCEVLRRVLAARRGAERVVSMRQCGVLPYTPGVGVRFHPIGREYAPALQIHLGRRH